MRRTQKGPAPVELFTARWRVWSGTLHALVAREWFWLEVSSAMVAVISLVVIASDLGALPFWIDESIAVLPARSIHTFGVPKSPFDLNYMAPQLQDGLWDPSAPLYRYSVAAVTAVTGFSETTTRAFSVFLGATMLVPCFALWRRVFGNLTAMLACAVLVGLPAFAHEAREARHFTFVALMMASTFYFLVRSTESPNGPARALWPTFMLGSLLGHYVGYLIIPIVVAMLVACRSLLLSRRFLWVYATLGAIYAAIMWRWGRTLPLFHDIGCHNRKLGCEADRLYYVKLILDYLGGDAIWRYALDTLGQPASFQAIASVALPIGLLLVGLWGSMRAVVRDTTMRPAHVLLLAWIILPVLLLSTRELKFQRYVFYVLPPAALFVARGAVLVSEWSAFRSYRRGALWVLSAVLLVGPVGRVSGSDKDARLAFVPRWSLFHLTARGSTTGNWLLSKEQGLFLRERMKPGDVAVTSFDDAGIGYYAGRFVYGFLNSERDDRFFLDLLEKTAARGATLWFVDLSPAYDECHTPGMRPRGVPCLEKYAGFYAACRRSSPSFNPACRRLLPSESRGALSSTSSVRSDRFLGDTEMNRDGRSQ